MVNKYVLPAVAILGVLFGVYTVVQGSKVPPASQPLMEPPTKPPGLKAIAGAGIIEARRENIPIGATVPGVVYDVFVKVGDKVTRNQPLFRLDERQLRAELAVRKAQLQAAQATLHKLETAPRPEDVPIAEALVEEARARVANAEIAAGRTRSLYERSAGPASDYDRDRFAAAEARAALAKLEGDLTKLRKGTWEEDLLVARAEVAQAEAQVEGVKIDIDRLTVRALTDGEILQVNVRPGQFAASVWKEPLIVMGETNQLNVRVDIDEQDLPLFKRDAPAVATLKGRPNVRFPLARVEKVEPYVIPKKNLTGDNSERVDTRVLQVVYALPDDRPMPLYVGQQMDVYLEAAKPPKGIDLDMSKASRPFEDEPAKEKAEAKADSPTKPK